MVRRGAVERGQVDLITVLLVVLIIAATAACIAAVWAFREVAFAARSARVLSDDTHVRFVPLLDKADVTVDAVNAELLRVDILVTRFEDAADRVSQTATTLHEIANAPERIAGGIAEKVRSWRGRKGTPGSQPEGAPDELPETTDEATANAVAGMNDDQLASEDQWQQIG